MSWLPRATPKATLRCSFNSCTSRHSSRSNTSAWMSLFTRREIFVEMREVTLLNEGAEVPEARVVDRQDWVRAATESMRVMTGGETAFAVLQQICSGLALLREISPGVALGTIVGGRCDGFQVVTKAGGFGEDQTLVDILRLFRP
mgnify:CR=1 FL=1